MNTLMLLIIIMILLKQNIRYRGECTHDSLSGLLNRRQFDIDIVKTNFKRTTDGTILILIDMDKFKSVNDTYGHAEGDRIIREFGIWLNTTLRTSDRSYRIGGDEFAVITNSMSVVSKIQDYKNISLSVGWADISKSKNAFSDADKMLYSNKNRSKQIF